MPTIRNNDQSLAPGAAAPKKRLHLNVYESGTLLIIGWTMVMALVLIWNWMQIGESTKDEAFTALNMTIERDLDFRAWATHHGGVYVPVTPQNPPNPYLSHVEGSVVATTGGTELTLLNPAYMMRQVHELRTDEAGLYSRLTSLDPVNPGNAADDWETQALLSLQENPDLNDISAITDFNHESSMRLMRPFETEEGCLKCHGHQGYRVGDVRGGISVATSLAPYAALIRSRQLGLLPGYGIIWLVGLGGIVWFMGRLQFAAAELQEQEARTRAIVEAIPDMLFRYRPDGTVLDAVLKPGFHAYHLVKIKTPDRNLVGRRLADIAPTRTAADLLAAIKKVVATGQMQIVKHSYSTGRGEFHLEERLVLENEEENTVVSIVRDVTAQSHVQAKLEYLSYHDELTGLHNRNYFELEFARMNKEGEYPISVVSADINGLKLINDSLGHAAGDLLLTNCAKVLTESLRGSDTLARVGGDEFVAILPATSEKEGREIVARIRANVRNCNERFPDIPLSLALGIATAEKSTQNLVLTYKEADDMMYQDKRESRKTFRETMARLMSPES